MDPLSHLVISAAAGYILAAGLRLQLKWYAVPLLSAAALIIDFDHLLPALGLTKTLLFHNIAAVVLAAFAVRLAAGRGYSLLFGTMLAGHLIMDMTLGRYGVPLLYPLSGMLFLIPDRWELWLFNDPQYTIISKTGIGLAAFAALVAIIFRVGREGKKEANKG